MEMNRTSIHSDDVQNVLSSILGITGMKKMPQEEDKMLK